MKQEEQQRIFAEELDKLIERMLLELDITTASVYGCLGIAMFELLRRSEVDDEEKEF